MIFEREKMEKEIEIDIGILASDIDTMQSRLDEIKKGITRMYDAVITLDSTWNGQASETFKQQFNSDREEMIALSDTIQEIIGYLTYAKDTYNGCESEVASVINSIRI